MKQTIRTITKLPGVTLIELLIVMAILPMLLVMVSSMFGSFMDGQERAVAQAAINQEQQYLLEKLAYDVGQSSAIVLPATDGESGATLRLQTAAGTVEYVLSGVTLMRILSESSAPVTSTRVLVDTFAVQRLGNVEGKDSVRLHFSLSSTASAQLGLTTRETSTTYTLR